MKAILLLVLLILCERASVMGGFDPEAFSRDLKERSSDPNRNDDPFGRLTAAERITAREFLRKKANSGDEEWEMPKVLLRQRLFLLGDPEIVESEIERLRVFDDSQLGKSDPPSLELLSQSQDPGVIAAIADQLFIGEPQPNLIRNKGDTPQMRKLGMLA